MTLEELNKQIIKCEKCKLCKTRLNVVCGFGNEKSEILFIGEAPGRNEDEAGLPFVGSAGKILDEMLQSINFKREDIYITNVVKCRPPKNRDPKPDEVDSCREWLDFQVEIIKPKLIVLLGRHSMERFLPNRKISIDHGQPKRLEGMVYYPVYHPAATVYRKQVLEDLKKDFLKIPDILDKIDKADLS
ncbi:uracil-DNA glycosylase [Patescibacteria group bacterium]|nr:uracil-DNA glycosylase [Patescibacteria group bacterium]